MVLLPGRILSHSALHFSPLSVFKQSTAMFRRDPIKTHQAFGVDNNSYVKQCIDYTLCFDIAVFNVAVAVGKVTTARTTIAINERLWKSKFTFYVWTHVYAFLTTGFAFLVICALGYVANQIKSIKYPNRLKYNKGLV